VIAKTMIEAHRGALALNPALPRGVDAIIWLPLANDSKNEAV